MIYGDVRCPYCTAPVEADWVDVGVPGHFVQCGPYHCLDCGASEIGPFDDKRELTKEEQDTGWYAPGSIPGSSANVINGEIVSHKKMKEVYSQEFTGNDLWHDKDHMKQWWSDVRK